MLSFWNTGGNFAENFGFGVENGFSRIVVNKNSL